MSANGQITRITLFKIPNAEDVSRLLDIYKEMPTKAVKVRHAVSLSKMHATATYMVHCRMASLTSSTSRLALLSQTSGRRASR